MSDEINKPADAPVTPGATDELKNLKAEFQRKFDNTNVQLQQILSALQKPSAPEPKAKPISVFDDEAAYAERIKAEAAAEAEKRIQAQMAQQQKNQMVVSRIMSEFPEVRDESSPLMQRARAIYDSYDESERSGSIAMKSAVAEAAAELGIRPLSKRSSSQGDDFSLRGSSNVTRGNRQDPDALNPATEQWAAIMGLDVSKPEVKARLKAHEAKNFGKSFK